MRLIWLLIHAGRRGLFLDARWVIPVRDGRYWNAPATYCMN